MIGSLISTQPAQSKGTTRALTRILKIGVKMAPSRNSWSFSIHLYWDFSNSWSQIQKVGVNYSKFGVNETSGTTYDGFSCYLFNL